MTPSTGGQTRGSTLLAPPRPDCAIAMVCSLLWLLAVAVMWVYDLHTAAVAVGVVAVLLAVISLCWRPMRSTMSGAWVALVPLGGILARSNQIRTCAALERAGIYKRRKTTATIPAHTSRRRSCTTVRFDGSGEAGMSPEKLAKRLAENARVWGARSYSITEDAGRPGRYTLRLYRAEVAPSALDTDLVGTVA